jgi:uncharacterized protein YceH (UPF0502 family)
MAELPALTPNEARILGVLMEKEKTTPDVYPMTVNALTAGCNQKTSRDPVMSLSESEVQAALEDLRSRVLVIDSFGASGRVLRYAHNFPKVYGLPAASAALLAVLMLRGPQTVSELRANSDRLYHFADASSVEGYLEELAQRPTGALTVKLPKQPGSREHRWAHLMCGEVSMPTFDAPPATGDADYATLEARIARLEEEVASLRQLLAGSTGN